ncbi:tyrosine-type recombinase/integrase [Turicibacter sanguinis]|uniref:tyrosine-type recombinase/integrase n=1 Tax=Turicibacter sanguinis TaxID=154288 RepID=UPI00241EB1AC|nr:site-specific integrase [Turicibacter sanguinis]
MNNTQTIVHQEKQLKMSETIPFPIEKIDISWMTPAQKKFYAILSHDEYKNLKRDDISTLAGYKSNALWYKAIKDERFIKLLELIGAQVKGRNTRYPSHDEIEYIKDPKEREEYLENDVWDMRKLFKEYPRHLNPQHYIANFNIIQQPIIRCQIKRYFKNQLSSWKPKTFPDTLKRMKPFFNVMYDLFPTIDSLSQLEREEHIEPILSTLTVSNHAKKEMIKAIKSMFEYMYYHKWVDAPSIGLLNKYDTPKVEESLPRPIPPEIKIQLDDYLESTIIPLLEEGKSTPIIAPNHWDLIIVIRYTGRRFEDIAHLIATHTDKSLECLQYDLDGDPQLYLDHRIAKIPKDLRIPIAHLKDLKGRNMVEQAILRQKERIKDLPCAPDGFYYLFREVKFVKGKPVLNSKGEPIIDCIQYHFFVNSVLAKISKQIPLQNLDGSFYKIRPHQFRHTVATEMIDAGVDIYAVKEFLGHGSVAMTEKYIKVYQQKLKKEFKEKLSRSDATLIKESLPEEESLYDSTWVKNKIFAVFEQGDGCCEHPYKMPACPHMSCKTCIKKKIYPRHLQSVKDTIESFTIHRDNALKMGLTEKAEEFDKVVKFHTIALEIINRGEVFEASKHFH